jgi:hypothetical protein
VAAGQNHLRMRLESREGTSLSHRSHGLLVHYLRRQSALHIARCKQLYIRCACRNEHICDNTARCAQLHVYTQLLLLYLAPCLASISSQGAQHPTGFLNGQRRVQAVALVACSYRWPIATHADVLERQRCTKRQLNGVQCQYCYAQPSPFF